MNIFSLLFLMFCIFCPVGSEEAVMEKGTVEAVENGHRDIEAGFEVKFPEGWDIKRGVMGADVIALAPSDSDEDLFRENVNIIHADLEFPITQDEYSKINMTRLEELLTDYDLEESDDVDVDGIQSKRLIYTHRMGVVNAKVMQYLILVGSNAYVITFTTDPKMFDQYRGVFDEIMKTFKFVKDGKEE